jgi:hypothetical protein
MILWMVNNITGVTTNYNVGKIPSIRFSFSAAVDRNTAAAGIKFSNASGVTINYNLTYQNSDSVVILQPAQTLGALTKYIVSANNSLQSLKGGKLSNPSDITLVTGIDSLDKFPIIADDSLLTLVQKQTFTYFHDFAHPVSGMARERNTSGDVVTTGGTGFGVMATLAAVNRSFITRQEGLAMVQKIVSFLTNNAQRFHGAFSHWMNGSTGAVVPFAANDDGADLVETSYMMMGLLCARQYFNGADTAETTLRNYINNLWNAVEWDWFRQGGKNVLYWNWSPAHAWAVNVPVQGWNETLITYVLAASSTTHSVPKAAYDSGFARNGAMKNGGSYYNFVLPLGPSYGGPLFFSHYSFMGINPYSLTDAYANYQTQVVNHSKINYSYCVANPKAWYGYSGSCWGLTASDITNGYTASSPANDVGVIAPTAAISSLPYTPTESLQALKFFYYKLGDRTWGQYGFVDAFSLQDIWFASSDLAIDEGPIIVMIENYRSGLLWNLFMSCPEVKTGMLSLGFSSPNL